MQDELGRVGQDGVVPGPSLRSREKTRRSFRSSLTYEIIGAAQTVHRTLGPGFLEAVYEAALTHELKARGVAYESQKEYRVFYKGAPCGIYRADLVVDGEVLVELKAALGLCDAHKAQTVSYLKASGLPVALLLNFGAKSLEVRRLLQDRLV